MTIESGLASSSAAPETSGVGKASTDTAGRVHVSDKAVVKQDTVKISVNAQVKQLSESGESAKQIAANLGMTEKEVEQTLGETTDAAAKLAALASAQ